MKYKKYPSYKDSGVEWLEEIPEHFNLIKLKYLVSITTGNKDTENKEPEGKYPFFVRSKNVERIDSYSYNGEAILTAGDGDIGKIFHYINGKFDFHQRVYMFYKFKNILVKFLYFYLQENLHKEVIKLSAKTTVDSLRLPMLQDFIISIPSIQEQQQIATFLDNATTKIDTLIEKQTKLIELLKEKRQAVISNAVTKGINPNVKMKDSSVEWLGEIPENYYTLKLSYCVYIRNGQVDPRLKPYSEYILIAPNHIEKETGKLLYTETAKEQGADSGKYISKKGEVIYSKIRPALAKVCISPCENVICSADMYSLNGSKEVTNEYIYWYLLTKEFTSYAIMQSDRVAMPKLNRDTLGETKIIIPPIKEQQQIANYLDDKTSKIDKLIEKANKSIELLKEKRIALISAAVTGKIDVR